MKPIYWSSDDSKCGICGEEFPDRIPMAEAYDPEGTYGSFVCHPTCALAHGLEIEWQRP